MCQKIDKNSLCNKCENILKKEAVFKKENYKKDNSKKFDEMLYMFTYQGVIRKIILDYKFKDKSYLYKTITNFLLKNENFIEIIKSYDIIMPVPISQKRQMQRGYNQSYLIAKEISKKCKLELNTKCLEKCKDIIAQSTLNKEERQKNIKNAYILKHKKLLANKKILIVDDIYTTGSTLNECSKVIKIAKTKKIGVLVIAKD